VGFISSQTQPTYQAVLAQSPTQLIENPGEKLALAFGLEPEMLQGVNAETLTLIDGRQVTVIKGLQRSNDKTVSAAFIGDRLIDLHAEKLSAQQTWRLQHGALDPDLAARLDQAPNSERFTVAVWYKAEVEPLQKPDLDQPKREMAGSSSISDNSAALTSSATNKPGEKTPTKPLSFDELPADVRERMMGGEPNPHPALVAPAEETPKASTPSAPQTDVAILNQIEAFQKQNYDHLRQQITPLRFKLLNDFAAQNFTVQYASEIAPLIILAGLNRSQVEMLAWHTDIETIYDASLPGGPLMEIARVTQNADLLENWGGYTGSGINVAIVEGERASNANPYLNVVQTRDTARTIKSHPTGVAGIVGSFHSTVRGIAPGVNLYSANGDDYATIAALQAAMDWASARVPIFNNSFWAGNCGLTSTMENIDRHMDYLVRNSYDLAVVASGNFNTMSCDNVNPGIFVASPSKGYNSLTVGNYQDQNTLVWSDDTMRPSSSYNTSNRHKPEVAASGSVINSTTTSSPWTGGIGSGTSYASPMVAGLAANIIQAAPGLANRPEAVSAIIMATALHNIEGDSKLSRIDGTGGMVASAALASVERGHYGDIFIDSSTTFPITYTQFAYAGETVRFAIRWLSNPSADYTTDPLPVDLDLKAYQANGSTLLNSSISSINSFEIVQFVAPASETYKFRIERFGSWSGSGTWLGLGWWRGVYRTNPDVGYSDPKATPMGTHLAIKYHDWSPTYYWRVMGVRSVDSDHDLYLSSHSLAEDPGLRVQRNSSLYSGSAVDFIASDGNHYGSSAVMDHYHIDHWSGTGGYRVNWSNLGVALGSFGVYGPYSMTSSETVKVFDLLFNAGQQKIIQIIPTGANAADLGIALLKSDAADANTWHRRRSQAVASADASVTTSFMEKISYQFTGPSADYLGLVVYSNTNSPAQFYIYVSYPLFLPVITR
jgi:hypothetical protein